MYRRRAALVLCAGLAIAGPALARAAPRVRTRTPAAYLQAAPLTNPMYVSWAMMGLESDGVRPNPRMVAYLTAHEAADPGSVEREILALAPIRHPVGLLVTRLDGDVRRDGSVGEAVNLTAFAVVALAAGGRSVSARTANWLAAQQDGDGGFSYDEAGDGSDVDDTGAALEALAAARAEGLQIPDLARRITRAVTFIDRHQNRDGGLPSTPGGPSNAQSTAWAIQGLIAVGQHPARAQNYLRHQTLANGQVDYAAGESITPVWVTGQALMGLTGRPLPLPDLP